MRPLTAHAISLAIAVAVVTPSVYAAAVSRPLIVEASIPAEQAQPAADDATNVLLTPAAGSPVPELSVDGSTFSVLSALCCGFA